MNEGKIHCSLIMALLLTSLSNCDETTQQYLENVVRSLKNLRQIQTFRRGDVAQLKEESKKINRRSHQYADDVPPLSLTKGELAALYEQAVHKGETIKLDTGHNEHTHALVHYLDDDHDHPYPHTHEEHHEIPHDASEDAGYYYYYYPIKSFLDGITSQPSGPPASYHRPSYHHKELTTHKPPYTYHSHHHEHNVTIQQNPVAKNEQPNKPLEPLFMAISGFIGMALMFLMMILMPKFGFKTKVVNDMKKKDKLDDFARFALKAIEGHCAERFACELTKTARSFDLEDNRFYKLLKRMAPGTFGRIMNNAGKYSNKQLKCTAIPCTKRRVITTVTTNNKKPLNNQKKKNNANKKH